MRYDFYEAVGEGLFSQTLENGLAVFIFPKKGYHKALAHFAVHYGGSDMRFALDGQTHVTPAGVAHFLEHKLFDTKKGNALTLLAQAGASPNAYTNNGMTAYHFTCTERFFENLETLLSFVTEPYFTPESVEKEQGIIAQEIGMYDDDPDHAVYMGLMETLFRENPIRVDIAGTVESIREITADTLYLCHNSFYVPTNMALTVVGDVDPEKVLDYARRLTPEKAGLVPARDYGAESEKGPRACKTSRQMAVSIPQFCIGSALKTPEAGQARQKCRVAAELAASLLCGEASKLYVELYAKGMINRNFYAAPDFFPGGGAMLCAGESAEPERVFDALRQAAADVIEKGVDEKVFSRLKKALIGECIFGLNSFDEICYNQAADYFDGGSYLERFTILGKLTPEDVCAFVRENLAPEQLAMSVVLPQKGQEQ